MGPGPASVVRHVRRDDRRVDAEHGINHRLTGPILGSTGPAGPDTTTGRTMDPRLVEHLHPIFTNLV